MKNDEIFTIKVRRCLRCGGLLTSPDSIKDGYGHSCMKKMRLEAMELEQQKNQISLFDAAEPTDDENASDGGGRNEESDSCGSRQCSGSR